MLTALFVLLALYLLKILIFITGARRADRAPVGAAAALPPPVSVLVAARHEEQHLGRCLEALSALRYDG